MKLNSLVLLFLTPFCLLAQPDDYCPCMEESRQYEDLMQYFSSTADVSINVQPQSYTNSYYVPQESSEPAFVPMYMDVNNFPSAVAEEEEEVKEEKPEREERVAPDRSRSKAKRKAKIKRKRKRLKGKIKRKKRMKKYKGGCPF